MPKHELKISLVQKNLPELIDLINQGDEIIISKANVPIAKITPIKKEAEKKEIKMSPSYFTAKSFEIRTKRFSDVPENWFG